jgi:hypothetical protein
MMQPLLPDRDLQPEGGMKNGISKIWATLAFGGPAPGVRKTGSYNTSSAGQTSSTTLYHGGEYH